MVNKVVYGTTVLVDLTGDTVVSDKLINGYTAHDKTGSEISGTLVVQTCYSGNGAPNNSLGSDGDIYVDLG